MNHRDRFKLWHEGETWDNFEREWDRKSQIAQKTRPMKNLSHMPSMPGITENTGRHLKLKSLYYLMRFDQGMHILREVLKRPLTHLSRYVRSIVKPQAHNRDGDFFLYGYESAEDFARDLDDPSNEFILGFSYCHKPIECPSGRFTSACMRNPSSSVCRQCFIGKALSALPPERSVIVLIKTVHHIGRKIFEVLKTVPAQRAIFLISACELTLEMFGDFGNMTGVKGIGVRLDGRICNTMRAFELSERGIKPGLTVILPNTQKRILELIRRRRAAMMSLKLK